jgi:hypothetical protein
VDLEEHNLPATIADAYLVIRVVDTGDGHSAVGGYALVLAQPVRPAAEHVPLSVDTVQLVDEKETLTSDGGVIRRFRTVHGLLARQLVLEFDGLRAEPPGLNYAAVGCLESITATFRAGSQRWRASYSACGPVSVTRDGHRLPDLTDDKAFAKALIADSR